MSGKKRKKRTSKSKKEKEILEMNNYSKFLKTEYEISLYKDICLALSDEYLNEIHLFYNKKLISIEPVNSNIVVIYEGNKRIYKNIDEVFLRFMLDGKPFIERISEVEYE